MPFLERLAGSLQDLETITKAAATLTRAVAAACLPAGLGGDQAWLLTERLSHPGKQAAADLATLQIVTELAWPALVTAEPPLADMAHFQLANICDESPTGIVARQLVNDRCQLPTSQIINAAKDVLQETAP